MRWKSLGALGVRQTLARVGIGLAFASSLVGSSLVAAAEPATPKPAPSAFSTNGRPRIGLVLSGGGAKGFAHIGVIEELERRHIPSALIWSASLPMAYMLPTTAPMLVPEIASMGL